MKKYISILSLLTILDLQSCERIESGADTENPENQVRKNILKATENQSSGNDDMTVFREKPTRTIWIPAMTTSHGKTNSIGEPLGIHCIKSQENDNS